MTAWYIVFSTFILFQNIIIRCIPFSYVNYWDEIGAIICILYYWYITILKKRVPFEDVAINIALFMCICLGLLSNVLYNYQASNSAIVRDIVGFIKFPMTFIALYNLKIIDEKSINKFVRLLKIYLYVVLLFGILSLFVDIGMSQEEYRYGIHPFMFLYTHPTYYTTSLLCMLLIINQAGKSDLRLDCIVGLDVILGMRTKGIVFFSLYFFVKYCRNWLKKYKLLYWACFGAVGLGMAYKKLQTYASFSNSPRESLYKGAFELIIKCFPLGSGFATYASHISGKSLSKVYSFIKIESFYNPDGSVSAVIGDAGLPYYLGQFGSIGCILLIVVFSMLFKKSHKCLADINQINISLFWILIVISVSSEAILVNNGFELAFVLAFLCKLKKRKFYV